VATSKWLGFSMLRRAQEFATLFFASLVLVLVSPRPGWPAKYNKKKLEKALKHYEQGSALYDQGKRDAAIEEYRAALSLDGDEPYWHEALGVALEKQGESGAALNEYCTASQLSPHDSGLQSKCQGSESKTATAAAGDRVGNAVPEQPTDKVGGHGSAPSPLFDPEPPYTEKARILKYSGRVSLVLVIDAQGNVSDVSVLKPLPFGLAEQAIETVRTWKFRPATRNGAPVQVRVTVEVSFSIF
jgi:TonB family protein